MAFENDAQREEHIETYYKELYKAPTVHEAARNMSIEEFLGDAALEEEV